MFFQSHHHLLPPTLGYTLVCGCRMIHLEAEASRTCCEEERRRYRYVCMHAVRLPPAGGTAARFAARRAVMHWRPVHRPGCFLEGCRRTLQGVEVLHYSPTRPRLATTGVEHAARLSYISLGPERSQCSAYTLFPSCSLPFYLCRSFSRAPEFRLPVQAADLLRGVHLSGTRLTLACLVQELFAVPKSKKEPPPQTERDTKIDQE
jgi:hypothetical protein